MATRRPRADNRGVTGQPLPSGTLTFLFTDIEGSTKLLNALGTDRFHEVLAVHTQTLRGAFADGGTEVRTEGDSLFVVFHSAAKAVRANRRSAARDRRGGVPSRRGGARADGHAHGDRDAGQQGGGRGLRRDRRAPRRPHREHRARRSGAAFGATATLAGQDLGEGTTLRDLGEHRLKDLAQPERVYQLVLEGVANDFPPVRSWKGRRTTSPRSSRHSSGAGPRSGTGCGSWTDAPAHAHRPGERGRHAFRYSSRPRPPRAFRMARSGCRSRPSRIPTSCHRRSRTRSAFTWAAKRSRWSAVIEHVRGKRMLLVLDNFEQVLAAAPSVSALLASGPGLKVIASSRASLRISGEQEFPVPPLDLPDPRGAASLDVLAQSDAVRLFVERARAVKPDFMVTPENAAAVAEICNHLDGLPLAIELAAARVKLLAPQAMLPRLRKGLDLLASTSRDRDDRQRTLRGAIAWSYDLLDEGLQRMFARGSVFVGGASSNRSSRSADRRLRSGRRLRAHSELLDNSLIRQLEAAGEPRFRMLVTIREFAAERLAAGGEENAIRDRHLDAYVSLAERAAPELHGNDSDAGSTRSSSSTTTSARPSNTPSRRKRSMPPLAWCSPYGASGRCVAICARD